MISSAPTARVSITVTEQQRYLGERAIQLTPGAASFSGVVRHAMDRYLASIRDQLEQQLPRG
jgi:hypothetical protein